jgi:hypothetical protein
MGWFEKFALIKSDLIVSNLQNYGEHIKNMGLNRSFEWISNGIEYLNDTSKFNNYVSFTKTYPQFTIDFNNANYIWVKNEAFPNNLATGWFVSDNTLSFKPLIDFQQQKVRILLIKQSQINN